MVRGPRGFPRQENGFFINPVGKASSFLFYLPWDMPMMSRNRIEGKRGYSLQCPGELVRTPYNLPVMPAFPLHTPSPFSESLHQEGKHSNVVR
jgi:hypothetical protein